MTALRAPSWTAIAQIPESRCREVLRELDELDARDFASEIAIRRLHFDALARIRARLQPREGRRVVELWQRTVHPELFDDERLLARMVEETLAHLAGRHRLLLITKGDLRDQERKLAKSGLAERFRAVEILSEKDEPSYAVVLRRHGVDPARFLMVGNSLKSDILPVLALGGAGAHVPYRLTWAAERAEAPRAQGRFYALESIRAVTRVVAALAAERA